MKRFLFLATLLGAILPANAIIWHYDNFNKTTKQCRVASWSGSQPSSGKLVIPSSYKHTDGVTYTVVSIAAHALDNLTTVKHISIPSTIVQIGGAKKNSYPSEPENFDNCPALSNFSVDPSNTTFNTKSSMLYIEDSWLLAVPQALPVTNGALTLPTSTTFVSSTAFRDNTTITTLTLPRNCFVHYNGGLNSAKAIKTYKVTGTGNSLGVVDGILVDNTLERIISYPPAKTATSVTLPSAFPKIENYAFANTKVKTVDFSAVSQIGSQAFYNSSLTKAVLPGSVKKIGRRTFENSQSLASIHLETPDIELPNYFALDCKALTTVTTENPIGTVDDAAFKNCVSLTEFPFSGYTALTGDSIFHNCGFTKVVYNDDPTRDTNSLCGAYIFSACSNLEEIDASAIRGTEEEAFEIGQNFAPYCLKLTTLKLPPFTSLLMGYESTPPAFGYTCMLNRIEAGTIWVFKPFPMFCYSSVNGVQNYEPKVYMAVTANSAISSFDSNEWPVGPMFTAGNGAKVAPHIYCDSYSPSENYVCPTATYYVPGGTQQQYSAASEAGCKVRQNYDISFEKTADNSLKVTVKQVFPSTADVRDFKVSFNSGQPVTIGMSGSAQSATGLTFVDIRSVTVSYTVDGVAMSTIYPSKHWLEASVDGIEIDDDDLPAEYYNLQGIRVDSPSKGIYLRRTAKGTTKVIF